MDTPKLILDFFHFSRPTKEQETVLKAMQEFIKLDNQDDFLILCGAAGTGKTTVTSALVGYLNYLEKPYKIAAPTGRAARILGRKAKTTTSTIHSLIYIPHTDKDSGITSFKLKDGYNSQPTVYIIDEASMIPKDMPQEQVLFEAEKGLLYDLVSYVKKANVNNKIIFLGDKYQLPPIGETESYALNEDFLKKTFNFSGTAYLLTEVKRQADGSYILENATEIRQAMDEGKKTHPIAGKKSASFYEAINNYYKNLKENGPEHAITISVTHKANKFFNDMVRDKMFGRGRKPVEKGDLLMVVNNWSRNQQTLYNGDQVEVLDVAWKNLEEVASFHFVPVRIKLLFVDKDEEIEDYMLLECLSTPGGRIEPKLEMELRRQRYTKNQILRETERPESDRYLGALRLIYGHAITCNKAQGGEWKKVFINTLGIPSLKWQYTAVTRAIDEIERF